MKQDWSPWNEDDLNIGYARMYWAIFGKFGLKATEAVVITLIASLSKNKRGWCYASKKSLAKSINVSWPTLSRVVERLADRGLIEFSGERSKQWVEDIRPSEKWRGYIESIETVYRERRKSEHFTP